MKLKFVKMQGCGNDYIYFDCFEQTVPSPEQVSRKLASPHFGIGGDGIILIEPSDCADAKMRIFNQDGSEGKMCGNGIRCVGKYLYDSGRVKKRELTVETLSGIRTLKLVVGDNQARQITVDMGPADFRTGQIPVCLDAEEAVQYPVRINGKDWNITCVSMGNPHCVVFCEEPQKLDLERIGAEFEKSNLFPESVNTEFVRVIDRQTIQMRVWERGSGETLACGTGACASAVAAVRCGFCDPDSPITVRLTGGELIIRWQAHKVWMTGPAETVFTGEVEI